LLSLPFSPANPVNLTETDFGEFIGGLPPKMHFPIAMKVMGL